MKVWGDEEASPLDCVTEAAGFGWRIEVRRWGSRERETERDLVH